MYILSFNPRLIETCNRYASYIVNTSFSRLIETRKRYASYIVITPFSKLLETHIRYASYIVNVPFSSLTLGLLPPRLAPYCSLVSHCPFPVSPSSLLVVSLQS